MVAKEQLGRLIPVGDVDVVHAAYLTSYRVPGHEGPVAFVELDPHLEENALARTDRGLTEAIRLRRDMATSSRDSLDGVASWPLEKVTDENRLVGWLVSQTPEEFLAEFITPMRQRVRRPLLLEWMLASPRQAAVAGYRLDTRDVVLRLAVLANLVHAVALLHRHGMVYGDLSLTSAAFSVDDGRVRLLGCHAVAAAADAERNQGNAPHFLAPECQAVGVHEHARANPHRQDQATDVYKLALCIVRVLSRGRGAAQLRTADHLAELLDAGMMAALTRALSADPGTRPSALELSSQLLHCIERLTEPPEISDFRAVSRAAPRGAI